MSLRPTHTVPVVVEGSLRFVCPLSRETPFDGRGDPCRFSLFTVKGRYVSLRDVPLFRRFDGVGPTWGDEGEKTEPSVKTLHRPSCSRRVSVIVSVDPPRLTKGGTKQRIKRRPGRSFGDSDYLRPLVLSSPEGSPLWTPEKFGKLGVTDLSVGSHLLQHGFPPDLSRTYPETSRSPPRAQSPTSPTWGPHLSFLPTTRTSSVGRRGSRDQQGRYSPLKIVSELRKRLDVSVPSPTFPSLLTTSPEGSVVSVRHWFPYPGPDRVGTLLSSHRFVPPSTGKTQVWGLRSAPETGFRSPGFSVLAPTSTRTDRGVGRVRVCVDLSGIGL